MNHVLQDKQDQKSIDAIGSVYKTFYNFVCQIKGISIFITFISKIIYDYLVWLKYVNWKVSSKSTKWIV